MSVFYKCVHVWIKLQSKYDAKWLCLNAKKTREYERQRYHSNSHRFLLLSDIWAMCLSWFVGAEYMNMSCNAAVHGLGF